MKKIQHRWSQDMCFYCRHLNMRDEKGSRVIYRCDLKANPLPDSFIWRRDCRNFEPIKRVDS